MRIAVINEFSARDKNPMLLKALECVDAEVFNIGMTADGPEQDLVYVHTGTMAGLALASGAADFVVGGCGTGQGFQLTAMQFPDVFCGMIETPLDAWLFSQINAGNCISLVLNKGFGWAGDINLRYIFEKLFCDPAGQGYPLHRSESQQASRNALTGISKATHKDLDAIVKALDPALMEVVMGHRPFTEFMEQYGACV